MFAGLRGEERRVRRPPPDGRGGLLLAEGARVVDRCLQAGHHLRALLVSTAYSGPLPSPVTARGRLQLANTTRHARAPTTRSIVGLSAAPPLCTTAKRHSISVMAADECSGPPTTDSAQATKSSERPVSGETQTNHVTTETVPRTAKKLRQASAVWASQAKKAASSPPTTARGLERSAGDRRGGSGGDGPGDEARAADGVGVDADVDSPAA